MQGLFPLLLLHLAHGQNVKRIFSDAETSVKFEQFDCFAVGDLRLYLIQFVGLDGYPADEDLIIRECGPYYDLSPLGFGNFGGNEPNLFAYWDTLNDLGVLGAGRINYKSDLGIRNGMADGIFVNFEIIFGTTNADEVNSDYHEYEQLVASDTYTEGLQELLQSTPEFPDIEVLAFHSAQRQNSNFGENRPQPTPQPVPEPTREPNDDGVIGSTTPPPFAERNTCPDYNYQSSGDHMITCGTTLENDDLLFCLPPGTSTTVVCPGSCRGSGNNVFGGCNQNGGNYAGISSICAAAAHAGIAEGSDFRFIVTVTDGLEEYKPCDGDAGSTSFFYGGETITITTSTFTTTTITTRGCCDYREPVDNQPGHCRLSPVDALDPDAERNQGMIMYPCTRSFRITYFNYDCKSCIPHWLWILVLVLALLLMALFACLFCCQQENRRKAQQAEKAKQEGEPMPEPSSCSCGYAVFSPFLLLIGIALIALFAYAIWLGTRKPELPCEEPPDLCVTWWMLALMLLVLLCIGLAAMCGGSCCGDTPEPTYCTVATECPDVKPGYPSNITFSGDPVKTPPGRTIPLPQAPLSPVQTNPCEVAIEKAADIRASRAAMDAKLLNKCGTVQQNIVYDDKIVWESHEVKNNVVETSNYVTNDIRVNEEIRTDGITPSTGTYFDSGLANNVYSGYLNGDVEMSKFEKDGVAYSGRVEEEVIGGGDDVQIIRNEQNQVCRTENAEMRQEFVSGIGGGAVLESGRMGAGGIGGGVVLGSGRMASRGIGGGAVLGSGRMGAGGIGGGEMRAFRSDANRGAAKATKWHYDERAWASDPVVKVGGSGGGRNNIEVLRMELVERDENDREFREIRGREFSRERRGRGPTLDSTTWESSRRAKGRSHAEHVTERRVTHRRTFEESRGRSSRGPEPRGIASDREKPRDPPYPHGKLR